MSHHEILRCTYRQIDEVIKKENREKGFWQMEIENLNPERLDVEKELNGKKGFGKARRIFVAIFLHCSQLKHTSQQRQNRFKLVSIISLTLQPVYA